jgi:transposase
VAVPRFSAVVPPGRLIADKVYDVDSLRNRLKARRIKGVIPSTAARTVPRPLDRAACRRRKLIERAFEIQLRHRATAEMCPGANIVMPPRV